VDSTIVCCSRTIRDGTLKALNKKMEEDIKLFPQHQGKWHIFHI